ncbi:hypothetical protein GCM10010844_39540 [Deinococcus radiotolerans]|uniref:Uncharacterized protein n=1 Tax=Deinococcus radiotolerans TaxID=1309407 RepID=A0ABQ2FQJ3_9DEIO|nr:hypothetical protein GCM10010844_39540 [Deinococcus radiotolerans]
MLRGGPALRAGEAAQGFAEFGGGVGLAGRAAQQGRDALGVAGQTLTLAPCRGRRGSAVLACSGARRRRWA